MNDSFTFKVSKDERQFRGTLPALTCSEIAPLITPGALVLDHWYLELPDELRANGFRLGHHSRLYPASLNLKVHRALAVDGWQFLRMEPLVRERAISLRGDQAVCKALAKAWRKLQNENLNGLEIVAITARKLLGGHMVSLVAQARQVQISHRYDYGGCGQVFWPVAS